MVEVYNHTGVLAPEDRLEDCAPWLYHELGWRPPAWLLAQRRCAQQVSWPVAPPDLAVMHPAAVHERIIDWRQPYGPVSGGGWNDDWVDLPL